MEAQVKKYEAVLKIKEKKVRLSLPPFPATFLPFRKKYETVLKINERKVRCSVHLSLSYGDLGCRYNRTAKLNLDVVAIAQPERATLIPVPFPCMLQGAGLKSAELGDTSNIKKANSIRKAQVEFSAADFKLNQSRTDLLAQLR
jgi:hypothetical protein